LASLIAAGTTISESSSAFGPEIDSDRWTVHHWLYTDATGAQYRLDLQSGGLYTSKESTYVTFDGNTGKLRFNDGTFWVCAALSAGAEEDAGTFYPTLIQDSNGNQVLLSYQQGLGVGWGNSSGRLAEIHDAISGTGTAAFTFTYVDQGAGTLPHLQSITSAQGREAYSFTVATQNLSSPFVGDPAAPAMVLQGITNTA